MPLRTSCNRRTINGRYDDDDMMITYRPTHVACLGYLGSTGHFGNKGVRGPDGNTGATGATGQLTNHRRVARQAPGCPGNNTIAATVIRRNTNGLHRAKLVPPCNCNCTGHAGDIVTPVTRP